MVRATSASALLALAVAVEGSVKLKVPDRPAKGRQVVDPSYHAWSIEFSSFPDYSGNSAYSNPLNKNLINNLRNIGGAPLHIRVGGGSQNDVTWAPNQVEPHIPYYAQGKDQVYNITVGPNFPETFKPWPRDTQWIVGLPFENLGEYAYLNTTMEMAKSVVDALGDNLYALEIGNEWGSHGREDDDWDVEKYVKRWLDYANATAKYVTGNAKSQLWQIGGFHSPTYECQGDVSCFTTDSILKLGINDNNIAVTACGHQYMEDAWRRPWVTQQFLMNHNNTKWAVDLHAELAANSTAAGVPYVLGETNSLSGHGKLGVSDMFSATLWQIDYVLYAAQSNISRLYMHQGTGWKYSAYNPITAFKYPSGVLGTYYAHLFTATVLSGGDKQVELLVEQQRFVAYAIYDRGRKHGKGKQTLASIVAINLEEWRTEWDSSRNRKETKVELVLSDNLAKKRAKLQRLTAPGTDVRWGINLAGQSVDTDGKLNGTKTYERVRDGKVSLAAAEAVIINF